MKQKRYCMAPKDIALMQRDGMGWGHDLDAGCVRLPVLPKRRLFTRIWRKV